MKATINGIDLELTPTEFLELTNTAVEQTEEEQREAASELNDKQYETWSAILQMDKGNGVHYTALARRLKVSNTSMSGRLFRLSKLGYVRRIRQGVYQAVA